MGAVLYKGQQRLSPRRRPPQPCSTFCFHGLVVSPLRAAERQKRFALPGLPLNELVKASFMF